MLPRLASIGAANQSADGRLTRIRFVHVRRQRPSSPADLTIHYSLATSRRHRAHELGRAIVMERLVQHRRGKDAFGAMQQRARRPPPISRGRGPSPSAFRSVKSSASGHRAAQGHALSDPGQFDHPAVRLRNTQGNRFSGDSTLIPGYPHHVPQRGNRCQAISVYCPRTSAGLAW